MYERAVLITGCSSGIGKVLALALATEGYRVFATVRTHTDVDMLNVEGMGQVVPIIMDLTDGQSISNAVNEIVIQHNTLKLYAVINNAGVVTAGPLEYMDIELMRYQLEVNVIGTLSLIQKVLPYLRNGNGRIVNIGSVSGQITLPFFGPYSSSKSALTALTRALRMELKPWQIPATLVQPGNISTPIWDKSIKNTKQNISTFPEEAVTYYSSYLHHALSIAEKMSKQASSPDIVVKAVKAVLNSKNPKARYLVGYDSFLWNVVDTLLPYVIIEAFICKLFHLSSQE